MQLKITITQTFRKHRIFYEKCVCFAEKQFRVQSYIFFVNGAKKRLLFSNSRLISMFLVILTLHGAVARLMTAKP